MVYLSVSGWDEKESIRGEFSIWKQNLYCGLLNGNNMEKVVDKSVGIKDSLTMEVRRTVSEKPILRVNHWRSGMS